MNGFDGSIKIDTKLDHSGIENGINKLKASAKIGALAIGTAVAAGLGLAVKAGMDFEAQMSKVAALSGATSDELDRLTKKAKQMGADTKYSASQSAEAFQFMAQAGWKTAEMVDGIGGIMSLAAADGLDLATTASIVTNSLTAFGLKAKDAGHFADVLAVAAAASNTNVQQMGETFQYAAPVAGALGYTIEDMALATGLMANMGIQGSQAGTALRATFTRLAKPTKQSAEAMAKLHLSLTDTSGKIKPLNQLMDDMRVSFAKLTPAQKAEQAAALGGQEAMSGLLAIVNASPDAYLALQDSISGADGVAKKMADTMQNNLAGQLESLGGSVETLGLNFYDGIKKPLTDAAKFGIEAVNKLAASLGEGQLKGSVAKVGKLLGDLLKTVMSLVTAAIPPLIGALAFLADNLDTIIPLAATLYGTMKAWMIISTVAGALAKMNILWLATSKAIGLTALATAGATSAQTISAISTAVQTGAMGAQAIVAGVLAGQIGVATGAQLLWNAALVANPIGAMILVCGAFIGIAKLLGDTIHNNDPAYQAQKLAMAEMKTKTDELCSSSQKLIDTISLGRDAWKKDAEDTLAKTAASKELASKLFDLADKEKKTNSEKAIMAELVNTLNKTMPDLKLKFNEETGALEGTRAKTMELIDAKQKLAEKNAAMTLLEASYVDKYKAEAKLNEVMIRRAELQKQLDDLVANPNTAWDFDLMKKLEGVENQLNDVNKEAADLNGVIYDATKGINYSLNVMGDKVNATSTNFIDRIKEIGDKAPKTLEGVKGAVKDVADDMEKNSAIYGADMIAAWKAAMTSAPDEAYNDISAFMGVVLTAMEQSKKAREEGEKVGAANINGIIAGMTTTKLTPAAQAVIDQIAADMRARGIIKSPSKLMRDKVGKPLAQGVAVGIEENAHLATEAAIELVDGVITAEQEYQKEKDKIDVKRAAADEARAVKEYKERLKNATDAIEIQQIKDDEIERLQTKADDKMLEGMQETADKQRKIVDKQKEDIIATYTDIADKAGAKLSEIIALQDTMAEKLKGYGEGLFSEVTISAGGKDRTFTQLTDFTKDINSLNRYKTAIDAVNKRGAVEGQTRGWASPEFMGIMKDMSVDEGTAFAEALGKTNNAEFKNYLAQWQQKQDISKSISKELYVDEATAVVDEMSAALTEAGLSIPEGFFDTGKTAAENFGTGFVEKVAEVMAQIKAVVDVSMEAMMPTISYEGGVPHLDSGQKVTNNNFTIGTTKNTAKEQIDSWMSAEAIKRMRGGT